MACRVIYKPGTKDVDQVFAPNGNPSILFNSLNELSQDKYDTGTEILQGNKNKAYNAYLKTQTQSFKNWFGDSQVIDENGEPLIVYHGSPTASDIQSFNAEYEKNTKHKDRGFYFTTNKHVAKGFIGNWSKLEYHIDNLMDISTEYTEGTSEFIELDKEIKENIARQKEIDNPKNVIPVFLNVTDPVIENFERSLKPTEGYSFNKDSNGAIFKNVGDSTGTTDAGGITISDIYIAFKPNQIKHAVDNVGEFNQNLDNMYAQRTAKPGEITENKVLNLKLNTFLESIGVSLETVKAIKDREGNPLDVVATSDMINKVIKFIEGHTDGTTLPEEAAHFFVQLLKQNDSSLYKSMRNKIQGYPIYDQVKAEYGELYQNDVELLADEAIGKLIARHLLANEDAKLVEDAMLQNKQWLTEQFPRVKRWWNRAIRFFKKILGISNNPYKLAAYRMLNEELLNAQNTTFENPNLMHQASTESQEGKSLQEKTVFNLLEKHQNLRKETLPIEDIPGLDMKLVREGEIEREAYIYTDPTTGTETILPERVTNAQARKFAKNKTKEQVDAINNNPRNKHLALGGQKLHGVSQNLMEFFGNKSSVINVETTHSKGIPTNIGAALTIDGTPMKTSENIKKKFQSSVKSIINQIETQQKEINEIEGTPDAKATLLTELQVSDTTPLDGGQPIAGTMDVVVVFSNGKIGIIDFKFVTPQGWYTKDYGPKTKIVVDPMQVRVNSYNTQIGAYKDILIKEYNVNPRDFIFTRIAPAHIQYKVKSWKAKDYTLTEEVEVFEMGADQNEFMTQLSVAGEITNHSGLNDFLKKVYRQRTTYENELMNTKGQKRENLRERIQRLDKTIQGVTVKRNIAVILQDAADSIKLIQDRLQISDQNHADYLTFKDLRTILTDFSMYNALNEETSGYLRELEKVDKEAASKIRAGISNAANHIQTNFATIQEVMFNRLTADAAERGIDTTESPKEMSWTDNQMTPMSDSKHPIMRHAYDLIYDSFNKTKQETDAIYEEIMVADVKIGEWAKKNGMTKFKAMGMLINPKTGNLFPKLKSELYDLVKEKQAEGDIAWLQKHLQPKKEWKKKVEGWRYNKIRNLKALYPDLIENGKIIKSNANMRNKFIEEFDAMYDLDKGNAWKNPRWFNMLEFKEETMKDWLTEEYAEILKPGNKALKGYYDMYWSINNKMNEVTPDFLQGNFVSNTRDDMMQSVVNNGFNFASFTDRMRRSFTTRHVENQEHGIVNPDGSLVSSIPIPGLMRLTDSKGNVNVNLKSKDLSKSLYDLAISVYNYKHMDQIESTVLALGDQLQSSRITMTDAQGNIIREHGEPLTTPIKGTSTKTNKAGQKTLDSFNSLVDFYIYGHSTQTKDRIGPGGLSLNRTIKNLMSMYSAKKIGFPILPSIAAKILGETNLYIQSIDGISYDREGMRNANKMFVGNMQQYSFFANVFDAHQSPQSWVKSRNASAKKAAKWLEFGNIYEPLRWTDESLDRRMTVAMGYKHGLDEDGNLKRLDQLPEGSKNLHELTIKNDDGTYMIQGMTDSAYKLFRQFIKGEGRKIKGQMDSTDIVAAKLTLMGQMLGQFKWWMPGLLAERFKGRRFNPVLKYLEEGRYQGMGRELISNANMGMDKGLRQNLIGSLQVGVDAMMQLTMLKRFQGDPIRRQKLMDKGKWSDKQEASYQAKRTALELEMKQFKMNSTNPDLLNLDLDAYVKMRSRSVKRSLSEVRSILGMYLLFAALGAVGDDDEKFMQQHYATRQLMKILGRARKELGFVLDPREFAYMLQGGIPVVGLLNDIISTITNGFGESYDVMIGRQTLLQALGFGRTGRDKSPLFYHTSQFVIGFEKMRMILEPFPQDKVNPYK